MKKIIIIFTVVFTLFLVSYLLFHDYLPPRNPYKIARNISALNIQKNFTIEIFNDKLQNGESFFSSGDLLIKFSLDENQFKQIKEQAKKLNYKVLPIKEFAYAPSFVDNIQTGYYMLENSNSDPLIFNLVVISDEESTLYIYVSDS